MRPLGTALALTLAALTIPSALFAQSQEPDAPPMRRRPPVLPRRPAAPRPPAQRPPQDERYRITIDGSVIDRYLATPVPKHVPKPKRKPTPRPKGAPDVFETHSTSNE